MHPITDKAEVAIDFPDKAYMGGFGRDCSFDAHADADGMTIRLVRTSGEKREAEMHLHHFLFAGILADLANSLDGIEPIDEDPPPAAACGRAQAGRRARTRDTVRHVS
ncbi:MAG TPA: hypothetical protein VIM52_07290 [Stellaceae bacterium]